MQIILIGNYTKDHQESMLRFSRMLQVGFASAGYKCLIWSPVTILGYLSKTTQSGFGKWLGYLDKFIIFPILLRFRLAFFNHQDTFFHICDHSNSMYLPYFGNRNVSITCHDVLAIRGALGFTDSYCQSSRTGKLFQNWILKNLKEAKKLVAVSEFTLKQLNELAPTRDFQKRQVIYNGFNGSFSILPKNEIDKRLIPISLVNKRYILSVGSSHPRKNRQMLLKMVAELGDKWDGFICFAGEEIDDTLIDLANRLNLIARLISILNPNHETLVALYNRCEAFIFPSYSEGFGWPLIEAQACGVPVIASTIQPMPEISGGAAIHVHPDDAKGFAEAFNMLQNTTYKNKLVSEGFENIKRFE